MRILYVSPHFPPDLGALANRVRDLCRVWVRDGHEVHVLCGMPGHPTGVLPERYRGATLVHEEVDGIQVHRTWTYVTPNAGKVRRSVAFASFGVSALGAQWLLPKPDVILATSPQFLAAVSGLLIGKLRGVPVVAEIRDLWPRSVWEVGAIPREHPVIAALERMERWLYREAAGLVVVSERFVEEVCATAGCPLRVEVVPNGVDLTRFGHCEPRAARASLGLGADRPIALYAGTHGMAHGLEVVIDAARLAPEIDWVLIGEGARKQDLLAQGRGIDNLRFLAGVPADRMPEVYAACDVALVPLRDLPLFETVIPSKIFEIYAASRPLVLGVRGISAELVAESGGGEVVPPEDAEALVEAVRRLLGEAGVEAGKRGRAYVEANYDRTALARRYEAFLGELVTT